MIDLYEDIFDLNGYNLSYDFLNGVVGIDVKECYPYKTGFCIVDKNDYKYLMFKTLKQDSSRYVQIFDILKHVNSNCRNIIDMYEFNGKKYFVDKFTCDYYVVFNVIKGDHKKWIDFNINSVLHTVRNFYNSSEDIFSNLYSFNLKEDLKLLTVGDEIKAIDEKLSNIENIEKFILYKHRKVKLDELFLENSEHMKSELTKLREFFTSKTFKTYVEDYKNIRFINGDLSNKSFVFNNDECNMINFYNASIDLFVKDISILVEQSLVYLNVNELKVFLINLLDGFHGNIEYHLEILCKYIRLNNYVFNWFDHHYKNYNGDVDFDNKATQIIRYKENKESLIKELSFT